MGLLTVAIYEFLFGRGVRDAHDSGWTTYLVDSLVLAGLSRGCFLLRTMRVVLPRSTIIQDKRTELAYPGIVMPFGGCIICLCWRYLQSDRALLQDLDLQRAPLWVRAFSPTRRSALTPQPQCWSLKH